MPSPKKHSMPDPGEPLDVWAAKIAALEPDVARGVIKYAQGIAGNVRVPKADREVAQAQADAVKRAIAKAKRRNRK
jgi:hypothetical protein